MPTHKLDKQINELKAEIEWLRKEKELRKLETDRQTLEKDIDSDTTDHNKKDTKQKKTNFVRFVALILFLIAFFTVFLPLIRSFLSYIQKTIEINERDQIRKEILYEIKEAVNLEYYKDSIYPKMIIDEGEIKLYVDTMYDTEGEIEIHGHIIKKINILEKGFENSLFGRSGCENSENLNATANVFWICYDTNNKEIGVLLENNKTPFYIENF